MSEHVLTEIGVQYISQGETPRDHLVNIGRVCEAGGRWIQLRLKEVDAATYLTTALKCREICDQYGAIMIVNDQVSIAKAAQADGVHLGLNDMSPQEARKILGPNSIIGGTANTLEDCLQHAADGVDYLGVGPFRYTTTKKKLSPVLGVQGYRAIMTALQQHNIALPVVAIGGITATDIREIISTGVRGVAVSGMLTAQEELEEKIETIKAYIAEGY